MENTNVIYLDSAKILLMRLNKAIIYRNTKLILDSILNCLAYEDICFIYKVKTICKQNNLAKQFFLCTIIYKMNIQKLYKKPA
ncbi:MAG: hypothetical protein RR702_02670 [Clostridia bacterium]